MNDENVHASGWARRGTLLFSLQTILAFLDYTLCFGRLKFRLRSERIGRHPAIEFGLRGGRGVGMVDMWQEGIHVGYI